MRELEVLFVVLSFAFAVALILLVMVARLRFFDASIDRYGGPPGHG